MRHIPEESEIGPGRFALRTCAGKKKRLRGSANGRRRLVACPDLEFPAVQVAGALIGHSRAHGIRPDELDSTLRTLRRRFVGCTLQKVVRDVSSAIAEIHGVILHSVASLPGACLQVGLRVNELGRLTYNQENGII